MAGIHDDLEYNDDDDDYDYDYDYDNAEHNEDGPNDEDDFDGDNSYGISDEEELNGNDKNLLDDAEADAEDADDDYGAQNVEQPGAPERAYNLRDRSTANVRFRDAIDHQHSAQSYYPPTPTLQAHQFHQVHKMKAFASSHDKCKFAAHYVLAHVSNSMQADAAAGIKKTQMSFKEGLPDTERQRKQH